MYNIEIRTFSSYRIVLQTYLYDYLLVLHQDHQYSKPIMFPNVLHDSLLMSSVFEFPLRVKFLKSFSELKIKFMNTVMKMVRS